MHEQAQTRELSDKNKRGTIGNEYFSYFGRSHR